MAQQLEAASPVSAAQPVLNLNERRMAWDGEAYTFLQFVEYYGVTAGLAHWMLDSAEQPVGPTASFAEGSAEQPVGIIASLPLQCVAAQQVSAGQPGNSSQNDATQPNQTCDLALFIHYVPRHALARGSIALVCRNWLQVHREHAWRFMVLSQRRPVRIDDLGRPVRIDDLDMSDVHTTVKSFLSAPLEVQQRAALSAKSLTLKIADLGTFLDDYEKWMDLPFGRLVRLVIEGPTRAETNHETCSWPGLEAVDGLRLGLVLSKLSPTVETLILKVSLFDEYDQYDHPTMAAIVSIFPKLKVLGIPEARNGLFPRPKLSAFLECCQGLAVDINTFRYSWLAQVPRLERLHLNVSDPRHPAVFDCAPLLSFLADKCPRLYYLHIHFEGERAFVHDGAFARISTSVKWLVLSFDDVVVEGLSKVCRRFDDAYIARGICNYLRPLVPHSCKLCILEGRPGGLWTIDVEDSIAACAHAACA